MTVMSPRYIVEIEDALRVVTIQVHADHVFAAHREGLARFNADYAGRTDRASQVSRAYPADDRAGVEAS